MRIRYFLLLLAFFTVIASNTGIGQNAKSTLAAQLLQRDSVLFHVVFNNCNLIELGKILSPDFEFYQENELGITTSTTKRAQFIKNIADNFCSKKASPTFKMRREPMKETVTTTDIGSYGVIQTGIQKFYYIENSKEELVEVSKFTRLWKKLNGAWQLVRESDQRLNPGGKEMTAVESSIPYIPVDAKLYNTILAMDSVLFDAYNTCKMDISESLYSDSIEFFHDKGGLSTSKKDLIQALKNNICDKVTRHLMPNSIEVSPIPGYGAVEIGRHGFKNKLEPDQPIKYSRFVIIWQYKNEKWIVAKVISLH